MTLDTIIDGIIARKDELNASSQQIADAAQVSVATVNRILRKQDGYIPNAKNLFDIANALGYSFDQPNPEPAKATDEALQQIIYVYEQRCADLERESRLKTVQTNIIIAGKDRWIRFLTVLSIVLFSGIALLLLYDVTHPDIPAKPLSSMPQPVLPPTLNLASS